MNNIYTAISKLGKKYGAEKIVLFGSRARNDNRERSDVDIAVFGINSANKQALFTDEIEQLPTLLDFDIVFVKDNTSKELLSNIERDGVILMNKFNEKLSKFSDALNRLEESLEDYELYTVSSVRDGVIQRFEFCTELAWKSTREYLLEQGYTDINSPKSVMKLAYSDSLIDEETGWIELLNARNQTSHIYDDNTASDIFEKIKAEYIELFKKLLNKLQKENSND